MLDIEKYEGSNNPESDGSGSEFPPFFNSHLAPSRFFCKLLLIPLLVQLLISGVAARYGSLVSNVSISSVEDSVRSTDAVEDEVGSDSG